MKAVCVLRDDEQRIRGTAHMVTNSEDGGVTFTVNLWTVPPGKHGFHVHRSGNLEKGSHSLCDHFSSPGKIHGALNDAIGHEGDLGNLQVNSHGECRANFTARYLSLEGYTRDSIIGRSLVVHTNEDDLGLGEYSDSQMTGHSGDRLLYGIIGIDEDCTGVRTPSKVDRECSIL